MSPRSSTPRTRGPGALGRAVPIFDWLPHYQGSWLAPDLIAGASVWALVIPQAIAYASIVGVPPQYGLYTVLGAAGMYAVFASTRQVVTGPSATVAAVAASVAALLVATNSPQYLSVIVGLTLATAAVYLLLGAFRMGWVSNFLAKAVLEGFVFAFGFGLIVDQLHKILGVPKVDGSYWQILVGTLKELPETNVYTLAVGATAIVLLLLGRYFAPKVPRAIIVVVLGIAAVPLLNLTAYGVAVVGPLPSGLPHLTLPTGLSLSQWATLVAGSLAVILVGFSESIAAVSEMATKHNVEVSSNQEMIAQGAAHLGSSLLGGFPVDGSLSKTSLADSNGQKSQLAAVVVASLTVVTLLFLTGLFANLPKAILGAVVIDAAVGLIHFKVPARFAAASRRDFAVFVATAIGLFFIGVVAGVIVGVILSLLLLIAAASKSPIRRMAFDASGQVWVDADAHPDAAAPDGLLVVEVDGPLFFADAAGFRTELRRMVAASEPTTVIVDLGAAADIDLDGADTLSKLARELGASGVRLVLARVDDAKMGLLKRAGTLDAIGSPATFASVRAAVEASAGRGDAPAGTDDQQVT